MVLLASAYDQSKYFKAADLTAEKKLKIKSVTEELIGQGADQKKMLACGSRTMSGAPAQSREQQDDPRGVW